jgi:hypothetical protein
VSMRWASKYATFTIIANHVRRRAASELRNPSSGSVGKSKQLNHGLGCHCPNTCAWHKMLAIATASTVVVFFFLLCFIVQNLPSKRTEQHSEYCGFVDCLLCVTRVSHGGGGKCCTFHDIIVLQRIDGQALRMI